MNRILKAGLLGALCVGLFAAVDGLVIGLLVAFFTSPPHAGPVIGLWTAWFTLVGAALGAFTSIVFALFAGRMTLPPPEEREMASDASLSRRHLR